MKDTWVRDEVRRVRSVWQWLIEGVEKETRDIRGDLSILEKRVSSMESTNIHVRKCPVCKHETLMKRKHGVIDYSATGVGPLKCFDEYENPPTFTCLNCGKTFKEADGLVEV